MAGAPGGSHGQLSKAGKDEHQTQQPSDAAAISTTERAISAFVGYTCGAVVVLPFDRVKSLLQVSSAARHQGALPLAREIWATQGVLGLYKGAGPHMLIAPYTVLYYSMYEELRGRGHAATEEQSGPGGHALVPLGAAICARTVETSIRMPLELLRTMMQTAGPAVTLRECTHVLLKAGLKDGPGAWFRGMVPTLLRDVPFSAIYWLGYETAKSRVRVPPAWVPSGGLRSAVESFVSGAGAGMLAAVVITPLDVVKTIRQHHVPGSSALSYASIMRMLRDSPGVAFAGLGPRLVRVPAGLATMMAALEYTKRTFEQRRRQQPGVI